MALIQHSNMTDITETVKLLVEPDLPHCMISLRRTLIDPNIEPTGIIDVYARLLTTNTFTLLGQINLAVPADFVEVSRVMTEVEFRPRPNTTNVQQYELHVVQNEF